MSIQSIADVAQPEMLEMRAILRSARRTVPIDAIFVGSLMMGLTIVAISSSMIWHTPGSYIMVLSIAQANSYRPHFAEREEWPIEIAGSRQCGTFPAETRGRKCVFDVMHYSFTRRECYYPDIAEEALSHGPWKWYLDPSGNIEIPQDPEALGRAVEVFVEVEYVRERCKYIAKLMENARRNDSFLVPQEMARARHVEHCIMAEVNGSGLIAMRTLYNPCIKLSDLSRRFYDVRSEPDALF